MQMCGWRYVRPPAIQYNGCILRCSQSAVNRLYIQSLPSCRPYAHVRGMLLTLLGIAASVTGKLPASFVLV